MHPLPRKQCAADLALVGLPVDEHAQDTGGVIRVAGRVLVDTSFGRGAASAKTRKSSCRPAYRCSRRKETVITRGRASTTTLVPLAGNRCRLRRHSHAFRLAGAGARTRRNGHIKQDSTIGCKASVSNLRAESAQHQHSALALVAAVNSLICKVSAYWHRAPWRV